MDRKNIDYKENKIQFVLVHLGKKPIPSYLWDCIRQIRQFNNNDIYLIANIYNIGINIKFLKQNNVKLVYAETLKSTAIHHRYRKATLNKWFWRFTTERFFYIYELMLKKNLTDVIHLENDNLIYQSVDDYYTQFKQLNKGKFLGITRDSNNRCIGGVMFIPNQESLLEYLEFIAQNPQLNDMQSLSSYFESKRCDYLPVVYKEYLKDNQFINKQGECLKKQYDIFGQADVFEMIFDAAALGQYIGGIDKIHDCSDTRGFINETACYDPSRMNCQWIIKHGKKIPMIVGKGYRYPVFNLHIHSKELYKYMSSR